MISITRALWAFWGQFDLNGEPIPVYQSGTVPDGAAYPYITFDARQAPAMETLPLVARIWIQAADGASVLAQAAAIMEAVSQAIPEGGVKVPLEHGFLKIHRGSGDFLSPLTDEDDPTVHGGRVGYEVTYYTV